MPNMPQVRPAVSTALRDHDMITGVLLPLLYLPPLGSARHPPGGHWVADLLARTGLRAVGH